MNSISNDVSYDANAGAYQALVYMTRMAMLTSQNLVSEINQNIKFACILLWFVPVPLNCSKFSVVAARTHTLDAVDVSWRTNQ